MKRVNLGFITGVLAVMVLAITTLSLVGFSTEQEIDRLSRQTIITATPGQVAGVAVEEASLLIDRGNNNTLQINFEIIQGMTVYDALRQVSSNYGLELKTTSYDGLGVIVDGIGDLVAGDNDMFWLYYVNGNFGIKAIDNQVVTAGDKIEFKFEANPY